MAEALGVLRSRGLIRVIPCLDVDQGRVVKGVNFVGLRDAGDPVELAARYDREGADELVFLDITAQPRGARDDRRARAPDGRARCSSRSPIGGGLRSRGGHPRRAGGGRRQGVAELRRGRATRR